MGAMPFAWENAAREPKKIMTFPERGWQRRLSLLTLPGVLRPGDALSIPAGGEWGLLPQPVGFYAEDEGANELTAVPGSRMRRVISQL